MNLFSLSNKPESIAHYEHSKAIEMNMALSSPQSAYYYALDVLFPTSEHVDSFIDEDDAAYSFRCKRDNFREQFKDGEKIIATDAVYSYFYATNILVGRFELGEPAIATNADCAYLYAKNVLKCRFELGEPAILSSIFKDKYESIFFNK
jgi:hypothetical protein